MNKQEIAMYLREAVKLMNDRGAHWVRGEYSEVINYDQDTGDGTFTPEYGFCSLGAIRHVTGDPLFDPGPVSDEVAQALAAVLPPNPLEERFGVSEEEQRSKVYDRIMRWNDDDDREWDDVVEKFEEAAALLET